MKVKFANRIFEVLYTKEVAGLALYAVEDEPNHVDWLTNVEVIDAEKVESKFHKGDWTVSNLDKKARQISEVHFDKYNSYYVVNGKSVNLEEYDRLHHLWSIHDAKDGDILADNESNVILLFRGIGNSEWNDVIDYHCYYDFRLKEFDVQENLGYYGNVRNTSLKPATKEQRNQLEKAMTEAGYTFDFKKKELKKIEQKSDDKVEPMSLDEAIKHCKEKSCGNNTCALEHKQLEKWLIELKELKGQKLTAWSKEDERTFDGILDEIEANKEDAPDYDVAVYDRYLSWLKSLKDRVQPRQEWSEEDENRFNNLIFLVECSKEGEATKQGFIKFINRLKFLREKYRWKPSKEQIIALRWVLNNVPYNKHKEEISALLDQIKDFL